MNGLVPNRSVWSVSASLVFVSHQFFILYVVSMTLYNYDVLAAPRLSYFRVLHHWAQFGLRLRQSPQHFHTLCAW